METILFTVAVTVAVCALAFASAVAVDPDDVIWDSRRVASGIYNHRIEAGANTATRQMILLKEPTRS